MGEYETTTSQSMVTWHLWHCLCECSWRDTVYTVLQVNASLLTTNTVADLCQITSTTNWTERLRRGKSLHATFLYQTILIIHSYVVTMSSWIVWDTIFMAQVDCYSYVNASTTLTNTGVKRNDANYSFHYWCGYVWDIVHSRYFDSSQQETRLITLTTALFQSSVH